MATRTLIALQMSYTDAQGDVHPQSVWIPATVTEDIIDEQGGIPSYGFSSAATLQAHREPCGQHSTQISKEEFVAGSQQTVQQTAAAIGMPTDGITQAQNTAYLWVSFAMATPDTPAPPNADGTPATNADGTPKMQSFFAGASVVTVQVQDGP